MCDPKLHCLCKEIALHLSTMPSSLPSSQPTQPEEGTSALRTLVSVACLPLSTLLISWCGHLSPFSLFTPTILSILPQHHPLNYCVYHSTYLVISHTQPQLINNLCPPLGGNTILSREGKGDTHRVGGVNWSIDPARRY